MSETRAPPSKRRKIEMQVTHVELTDGDQIVTDGGEIWIKEEPSEGSSCAKEIKERSREKGIICELKVLIVGGYRLDYRDTIG
ncbi:zinc finger protein [Trichonephila clavata]|uniref:Zinc finger protein n=1 Tax=Trichonephila clavata TaxID=2740835 RepID=A0A8X6GR72_TRICU|nr:zinc finger protein [Trichonephila clavata]